MNWLPNSRSHHLSSVTRSRIMSSLRSPIENEMTATAWKTEPRNRTSSPSGSPQSLNGPIAHPPARILIA